MADVFNDGSMQYGSQTTNIGGKAYTLKDISVTRPSNRILSKDAIGRPKKKVHIRQLVTGTATAQLEATDTSAPPQFATFTLVPAGGGTPVLFVIEETGERFEQESEVMCPITFSEVLNPNP